MTVLIVSAYLSVAMLVAVGVGTFIKAGSDEP